jgi:SAM-dependent methyltransferase
MVEGAANASIVVGTYEQIVPAYEAMWAPLLRVHGLHLLDGIDLTGALRVLDLGCGVGRLLPDISERAPRAAVTGTDLTEAMLRAAPSRFGRVVADATRSPFAAGVFDAVVSTFMLFHVPEPVVALDAARGALRPGGAIGVTVWGDRDVFPARDVWDESLDRLGVPEDPAAAGPPDGEALVNEEGKLRAVLGDAGFGEVRVGTGPWLAAWDLDGFLAWRRGMGTSRRRLASLEPPAAEAAFAEATQAVAELPASAFEHRDEIVFGWATA